MSVSAAKYKPFGLKYATTTSGESKLRFTGQWKDSATGLYVLFRRFYDPELGRFLSQDRILGHLTVPQSLNRYAYAVNNPLRYVDPTGEDWWNPLTWGQDLSAAVSTAAAAVGDWWAFSSVWDWIDTAVGHAGRATAATSRRASQVPDPVDALARGTPAGHPSARMARIRRSTS